MTVATSPGCLPYLIRVGMHEVQLGEHRCNFR